ncbi:diguanylate cyclase [Arcobacter vandammei]|uniref:diguanylate cyclase n=1 Tax=Arcobacter vandammei TaxID=2782243 RepID=UPI0018E03551|nr:diguanylate cyclase [Arcobacter vandammei]
MDLKNRFKFIKVTIFWLIISSLIIFSILFIQLFMEYNKSINDAKTKVNDIVSLVSEKLENDFTQIDNLLELAKNMIINIPNENIIFTNSNNAQKKIIIENKLNIFVNNFPMIDEIIFIDKDGFAKASSKHLIEKIDVNDRDYFQEIKNNNSLDKGFSKILITKSRNKKAFVQFNAIRDENKELSGVIIATINQESILNTLETINKASNTNLFLLNKSDYTLQLSTNDTFIEKDLINILNTKNKILKYKDKNQNIIASFEILKWDLPFIILSTLAEDKYLLNFKKYLKTICIFFILFLILSYLFFIYIKKYHSRELFLIKELKRSKARFENMFRIHSAIMLLVSPKNGNILDANGSALEFYGYTLEEIKNLHISQINISLNDELHQAKTLNKNIFHFKHKLKSGEIKIVEVNSSPIKTKDSTVLFSIIKDITKEKIIEEKLQKSYEMQKNLINLQENIIILTNGKQIEFANDKFLSFFGYENLEDFKEKHSCICDFFKEDKDFFCLSKIKNRDYWIEELEEKDDLDRLVKMDDVNKNEHIFTINISSLDTNVKIISFTDITKTASKNFALEEKLLHDKLTNAYNREFFDRNYKEFIKNYHTLNSNLAIAMLDIDHFKYVNDTFGHDIGDIVLQEFVEVVNNNLRHDDYLIRWGGEEFILTLKIKNQDDLKTILEKLRKAVEDFEFTKVGHRTSSFGGAIYYENENIMKTIKRADDAVYKAKQTGRNKVVIL